MKDPLDLQAWIIARHVRQKRLWEALGISRPHLWRIQAAACMPSHDLAARIAVLMAEDGIATTAGGVIDHQAARIAALVGDKGKDIRPRARRARKPREAKP